MRGLACAAALLLLACGGARGSSGSSSSAPSASPAGPPRADVVEAMNGISASVLGCLAGLSGDVAITFEFVSTGETSGVSVLPSGRREDGGPETTIELDARTAACVAGAASAARIRPFERETFTVTYPFRAR